MKKLSILLVTGIISCWIPRVSAQSDTIITENFDGNNITWTSSSASAWKIDNNYSVSSPNSIRGEVPNMMGDSIVLTSPVYDFLTTRSSYVVLKFSHICKVSPMDIIRVEYKRKGEGWQPLLSSSYEGKAILYQTKGFSAESYTEWRVGDSIALPSQSWWKEEVFDVSIEVGMDDAAQFRFVLKHGNTPGTQISYGWLIDNIEIIAAPYEIKMPVVEFVAPLIKDTVYSTGPWEINAKVKSQTIAQIENPYLVYTATYNQTIVMDSILMTMITGDSLWKAPIPQFILGTEVVYSITGKDISGNTASTTSGYVIAKPNHVWGDNSVALTGIISPIQGQNMGNTTVPVTVMLRNRGDSTLTSATIYRSINGTVTSYPWTGNLPWDFEQQVSIGTYQPRMEQYDTIVIWVSNPNSVQDIDLTDDTVSVIIFNCSANMNGTYTIGRGSDFSSMKDALKALSLCSPTGDITFAIVSDVHTENWDFTNISNIMGNYNLTITSLANNKDSVILRPASGTGILLNNSNNIKIENITVDATTITYGIQFTGACSNIVIRNCNLLQDSTTTSNAKSVIYKGSTTGIADNISITNNIIDGGYYGIIFYAGTNNYTYGNNILIDSNTIRKQSGYGIIVYYANALNISNNNIISRTSITTTSWYGIYLSDVNGNITTNRIHQKSQDINYPYGIYLQNFNYYYYTSDTGLIANNEIILNTTDAYPGIYANTYTKARILHNSIYISGTGAARGVQIVNNANNYMVIKNNNIVLEGIGSYPIYLNSTVNLSLYDMDYNNMKAKTYVGYAGGNKTNIAEWQATVTSDQHSISIRPEFVDSSANLKVVNYILLQASSILTEVDRDIEGIYRLGNVTAMGCYHGSSPYLINASLKGISGFRQNSALGQQDSIKVELLNTGTQALTSVTLKWSVNGNIQSTTGTWSGSLLSGHSTIVSLGIINYTQGGSNIIRAWIDNPTAIQDEYCDDDTTTTSIYICQSALSGSYTIGNGGTFPSWNMAIEQIKLCGIDGDIVFEFLPGEYTESIDLTNKLVLFGNYTLTLTSSTHQAEDVTIKTRNYGILLNRSNDVIIDAITIDAIEGSYAIQFIDACTNVVIRNCILLVDSVSTTSGSYAIYKESGTGVARNIYITQNIINGGSHGIYFYAGTGNNLYGEHIVIDSNIIKNQSHYGMYVFYNDSANFSGNTIISRESNVYFTWCGIYISYCNGHVTANHILQRNNAISHPCGIYIQYFNYYNTTDTGMIANNEIILNTIDTYYGIYVVYSTISKILHNSIYISGTGAARGIYLSSDINSYIILKNNNIIMKSPQAYPVYLASKRNLSNNEIDGNNMYAPTYIAYAGKPVRTLQQWQQIIITDKHAVRVNPAFINNTIDLQLSDYKGLECYPLIETTNDIQGNVRGGITAMGCYQGFNLYTTNAMLTDIHGFHAVLGTTDTLKVVLVNMGNTPLTNATFNWSFNGVTQSATGITWSGNLTTGEKDTIVLGLLSVLSGDYIFEAWISILGSLQDQFLKDDTTQLSGYICAFPGDGVISIGTTAMFQSIQEALDKLSICVVDRDITFVLESGIYNESVDLTDISFIMGNYYNLTITSSTHNAKDVQIITNNVGVILSNSNNIRIEALTIDARAGNYAVQFTGACTNVVIRDCKLLTDTVSNDNTKAPVYKGASKGLIDSIFIINNLLDGGYSGFYFYEGTRVVFDSNTITNTYYSGISSYYVDFTSCSYNTILSRTTDVSSTWYGIYIYQSNGPIIGNRIKELSTAITFSYGIYLYFYHHMSITTNTGLIANNEIMLSATSSHGISTDYHTRTDIVHNSIYITGAGQELRGIYLMYFGNNEFVVKNNNIVMESSNAYPIYIGSLSHIGRTWIVNGNNYYAPTYIGYAESPITSMAIWRYVVETDINSMSVSPDFIDSTVNLQLANYKGLECNPLGNVPTDINGKSRAKITVLGCHHEYVNLVNAKLTHISQWKAAYTGVTDTVKVQITNTAVTNITAATVYWSFNGSTPQSYTWNGSLSIKQSAILTLGTITFASGNNTLDIWIDSLGGLQDEILADDSIHEEFVSCNAGLNGTYTIGTGGNYTSIELAVADIKLCGMTGDVTFALLPGTYTTSIDLSNISSNAYSLTLTSSTNNANAVIIETTETTDTGIFISNSHNIIIKDLTVDAHNGLYGIYLNESCSDITIRDCHILTNSTTYVTYGIFKDTESGIVDNIVISNNIIEDGAYGICFYGGKDTNAYSTRIVIDSNTISNQVLAAMDIYYTDLTHISSNNISEVNNGIILSWSNGTVINNKVSLNTGINDGRAIGVSNYNTYNTTIRGMIANNEILLAPALQSNNTVSGIRISENTEVDILHNSIYSSGDGIARGIEFDSYDMRNHFVKIKNNNIRIDGDRYSSLTLSTPIYLSNIPNQYDIDYNNLYAPSLVGWIDLNLRLRTIALWQRRITTDLHSISVKSDFIDSSVNLTLKDYTPFLCPSESDVPMDIQGIPRGATTVMGAYTSVKSNYDLFLFNINRMEDEVVNNQRVQIGINVRNVGDSVAIDSAIFRWSLNGVIQPKTYKWIPSSPLQYGEDTEVFIDSFIVNTGYTVGYEEVIVWAEKINEGKDSITFDDTISKTALVVPLARFAPPFVADTINTLSFDVHVKIMEGTDALSVNPNPEMYIQTQMSSGTILYDTIDMNYNNSTGLWVAHVPQQYYDSKVIYSITVSDTVGNNVPLKDETYIKFTSSSAPFQETHIAITTLKGLIEGGQCMPDYVTATVMFSNRGTIDYDFNTNPVRLYMQVTQPEPFYLDTLISLGIIETGKEMAIEVTKMFPTVVAGQYDIRVWIDSVSSITYDDTLAMDYVSGKFSLPVDDDFSDGISIVFASEGINSYNKWDTVSQGKGRDTVVVPYFGTGMLAFGGSPGSMTTLSMQQLDLSRTVQPSLSFWYFHDTVPCDDYTDVRITVDGGVTYTTLFSLKKYDAVYGWKQYSKDLPSYAVNQCVILVFEAMEKSRSGNVTQYIDRIRITARQHIHVADVLTSEYNVCDLENKALKVVLENTTAPIINYRLAPATITLEVKETGQTFTKNLTSGVMNGFTFDTVTLATDFDFAEGTYTFTAYFTSLLDVNIESDTLVTSLTINPKLIPHLSQISTSNICLSGESPIWQDVILTNTGNMDLFDIELTLQIDTGETGTPAYTILTETCTDTIRAGTTYSYTFKDAYNVPWVADYYPRIYVSLSCNRGLIDTTTAITECVDAKDLYMISIDNPSASVDRIGSAVQVQATLGNRDDLNYYTGLNITVVVTNSQGVQMDKFTEITGRIDMSSTASHSFSRSYTVPNDTAYYLTVYLDHYDNYLQNDTTTIRRETTDVGIAPIGESNVFTLAQNVPNPANNSTRIDYSVPEAGKVIFHVHSISGQLLYSQTIETKRGTNSIELNTTTFAAGVYFYSMEYKGQRFVRQLIISN